jgi:multiple sugar transport system substrate-binding protein
MLKIPRLFAALAMVMLAIAGCGGGGDEEEGGAPDAEKATQAKASGDVTWCIGKDTSGAFGTVIDAFNKANPNANVKLLELPEDAGEQRRLQVQRLEAESAECDVLGTDVIWTAEYAAQNWLLDVSDFISQNGDRFIPSTVDTTEYEGKNFAVPFNSNAGFIYYRTDEVDQPPETWEDLYEQAQQGNGVVYQGFRYEGLTVNFLELLYSAGGKVLSDDGETVEVDSPEAEEVLTFMADGVKNGEVPKAVTTYMEEESRRAFESGNTTFMRNWPYAYLLGKESKIADKFDITPFPKYGGGEAASVLGGINLGISAYSKNSEAAAAFVEFAIGPEVQKANFPQTAVATSAPYDDPALQKKVPYAKDLKAAVEQGQSRPVSPVYSQITEAIYTNVHDALQGNVEPKAALQQMKEDIEKAQETF